MFKREFFSRLMIKPIFAWYDFWIGVFVDTKKSIVYILPIPMIGVKIRLLPEKVFGVDSLCAKCGWTGHHADLLDGYTELGIYTGPSHCPDCGNLNIKNYSPEISMDNIPF